MNKEDFQVLFAKATEFAVKAASEFVTDDLPNQYLYYLNINAPYNDLKVTETTHPELGMEVREYWGPKTASEITDKLWIEGTVPVWIDISVYKTDKQYTYLDLLACNRFSAEETDYYYQDRGMGPFGVKSPTYPPRWTEEMGRFSLQIRVERFDHLRTENP